MYQQSAASSAHVHMWYRHIYQESDVPDAAHMLHQGAVLPALQGEHLPEFEEFKGAQIS